MKGKSILIFGGGLNQLTLIKACNNLGYRSIVVDPNDNAPGKALASNFEIVAPDDYEKTKQIALNYKVDGIATSQMENPLRLMARLADEMGLLFNSPKIIEKSTNKYLMKSAFTKNHIPCAYGKLFNSKTKITYENLGKLNFPLIVKPVDSHSSRGVYKVSNISQLTEKVNEASSFSTTGEYLIEEFVEGPEYSIEAVTFKGETTIVQYTEKIITPPPTTVEIGHLQPATLSPEQKMQISSAVVSAINALDIDNTVTHTEVKWTKNGPVVIEIGPRMGGDFISSYLVNYSCGVSLDEATILMSVGEKPDLTPKRKQFSCIKYLQLDSGRKIKRIGNWRKVFDFLNVVFANLSIEKEQTVPEITDSAKRPGFVIVQGNDKMSVRKASEEMLMIMKEEIEYY